MLKLQLSHTSKDRWIRSPAGYFGSLIGCLISNPNSCPTAPHWNLELNPENSPCPCYNPPWPPLAPSERFLFQCESSKINATAPEASEATLCSWEGTHRVPAPQTHSRLAVFLLINSWSSEVNHRPIQQSTRALHYELSCHTTQRLILDRKAFSSHHQQRAWPAMVRKESLRT